MIREILSHGVFVCVLPLRSALFIFPPPFAAAAAVASVVDFFGVTVLLVVGVAGLEQESSNVEVLQQVYVEEAWKSAEGLAGTQYRLHSMWTQFRDCFLKMLY